jgi:hypothetical protein
MHPAVALAEAISHLLNLCQGLQGPYLTEEDLAPVRDQYMQVRGLLARGELASLRENLPPWEEHGFPLYVKEIFPSFGTSLDGRNGVQAGYRPIGEWIERASPRNQRAWQQRLSDLWNAACAMAAVDQPEAQPVNKELFAIAYLAGNPNATQQEVADAVGVTRQTLYDWAQYQEARNRLRGTRPPRGHRTDDGDLEAYDDE